MPAILSVEYTPNYPGNHRICFKTTGAAYCCYNDDSASVLGVPKTVEIDLDDFELCLQDLPAEVGCAGSVVDGYVQPICIEQGSNVNRIAFTATFPSAPCSAYGIECQESGIAEIEIVEPGYGWPVGVVPTVTVVDSTGQGINFEGELTMNCLPDDNFCSIGDITIIDPGQNYYDINDLTVEISPLPTCISNELLIDGNFVNGFDSWTVIPSPDGWELTPSMVPYYNIPVYSSTGGTLEQAILDPGKTYLIEFEKVTVESRSGTVRFIVTAGLFSSTGTGSNQYMITRNFGDPDFDGPLSITLTCFGSSVFSIYADSSTTDPLNTARLTAVSVIEICEIINPDLQVTSVDDCGTFIVPDCDGTANPTTYELRGGPQYAINVCSGGAGPEGAKYAIISNPVYYGEGPELVVNGSFTDDLSGWTATPPGTESNVFWTPQGVEWTNSDESYGISQDILTPGQNYIIDITLTCEYGPSFPPPIPTDQVAFELYFGTTLLPPIYFNGIEQSYQFDSVPCFGNSTFKLLSLNTLAPSQEDVVRLCSYVSIRDMNAELPVTCCDCVKYDVLNNCFLEQDVDIYYTDCNQVIQTLTVGETPATICCVRGSAWAVNKDDNPCVEITISATQDC